MSQDKRQARYACMMERLEPRLLLDGAVIGDELLAGLAFGATEQQVGGLSAPPPGYSYSPLDAAAMAGGVSKVLPVPEYFWYRGCGPTSVAMILAYWDGLAYPDYFPGVAETRTNSVDLGIASVGHDADWWPAPDRQPPPDYHTDDSIADFFKTSRGSLNKGWSWGDYADDAFNKYADYVGYSAANAYNIGWSGIDGGAILWAYLQLEIDAGRPSMFLVDSDGDGSTDHFIPVIGYRTEPQRQYAAYTTWSSDPGVHWFNWNPVSSRLWGISFATFFQPSAGSADLAGTHADIVDRTALIWGDSFTYDFGVNNYGTNNASGFDIKYYLSNNTTITSSDYYLGTTHVTSLAAGASEYGSRGLSLPSTPPAGFSSADDVWVGMIIDANSDVAEGVESNNRNLGLHKDYDHVRVDGKPDLAGTAFSLDYGIMNNKRGSTKATFTVANGAQGSTARSFNVAFYLSSNTTVSTGDRYLGMRTISTLAAGASYTGTISLLPGRTDPFGGDGTYTIGMVIDYDGQIVEANEGNNANLGFGLDKAEANYGKAIFLADFEHGDGAMNIVNNTAWAPADGLWHVELHRAWDAGHSDTHSMYYGRLDPVNGDYDYDVGDSAGVFYTKQIEMPDEPILLNFNYLAETSSLPDYDTMFVQVFDPDTGTYTTVLDKTSGLDYDTAGVWKWAEVDLTSFRGKSVQLRFGFDTISSVGNNREGWYVDDITLWATTNPVTVEAFRSLARDSDYYHEPSYVHWAGDHDTFVFNEEQWDGYFTITTDRQGSPVNPAIAVYDYETREMLYMDSGSGPGDEARIVLPNSGNWNTYLVEIWDTEEDSIGELDVHIDGSGTSGYGNVALDDAGDVSVTGTINSANDTDYFRMVAPAQASGTLDIYLTETSGDLRTRLQVWKGDDESPGIVRFADNGPEEATLTGVQPGDVFWISVSDHTFGSIGDFQLDVDFSTALPGTLTTAEGFAAFGWNGTADDSLSFGAYMNSAGDVDSYYFAGDTGWTGAYTITVNGLSGLVDPVVAVYNAATGAQLVFDDNAGTGDSARVSVGLNALTRYIVAVADSTGTQTGDVEIIISIADSSPATTISLDPAGDGSITGQLLNTVVDTDFYRAQAPADANGDLTVRVTPTTGTLNTAVAVFDASGNFLGQASAVGAGAQDALALTGLSPGANYYLSVLSNNYQTSGYFDVQVDFGLALPTAIDTATDVDFAWGSVNQFGDQTGLHSFGVGNPSIMAIRPEATGPIVLTMSSSTVDDVLLGLYNAAGDRVAFDIGLGGAAATINYAGTGAAVYYVYSSSYDGSQSGNYNLAIDVPSFSFTANIAINPSTGDGSYTSGFVSPKSDQDFFLIVAPANVAGVTITMTPDAGSALKPYVRLYDTDGVRLGADDAFSGAAQFTYSGVTGGATYVIGTGGNWYSSGAFDLDVEFELLLQVASTSVEDGAIIPPTGLVYTARFNDDALLDGGDFTLSGVAVGNQTPQSWSYNPGSLELTITYAALPADTYTLTLTDGITGTGGDPLDGDGNGVPGGDYSLTFRTTIPGDTNLDGKVNAIDYITLKRTFGATSGAMPGTGDFDGDGDVDWYDLQAMIANFGTSLGAAPAAVPAAAELTSGDELVTAAGPNVPVTAGLLLQRAEEAAAALSSDNSAGAVATASMADQALRPASALAVTPLRVTMWDTIAARPGRHSPSVLDHASISVAATPIRGEDSGGDQTIGTLEPSKLDVLSLARVLPMAM